MNSGAKGLLSCVILVLCMCPSCPIAADGEAGSTPAQEALVYLEADGSGDYRTLAEAVAAVPEGATVTLASGIYQLAAPLVIDRPLALEGKGTDQTEIVCCGEGYVVEWLSNGRLHVSGITFRHEGEAAANVLSLRQGEVLIQHCRFSGGRASESGEIFGAGLVLSGGVSGSVGECVVEGNGPGVMVLDSEDVVLERSIVQNNSGSGLCFTGNSEGVARENTCSNNGKSGIFVGDSARPVLEGNNSSGNANCGIVYRNVAAGSAVGNTCSGNNIGIAVADDAHPTLDANNSAQNTQAGIWYTGNSRGMASGNECSDNGVAGIYLDESATPSLWGNLCMNNGMCGIAYWGNAEGTASGNECSGNNVGILVQATANPELAFNNCHENATADILDKR